MKKFFSLVLALVMVMSLTTAAWGLSGAGTEADPWVVTTESELKDKLAVDGYVKLGANITIANTTGTSNWAVVDYGKTVTLDLAGYTITRTANDTLGAIRVLGELIVNDSSANKTGGISGGDYAIVVGWKGYQGNGAKLTINAGTFTGGYAITGNGTVPTGNNTTNWGTTITINGGTITGTDVGIYHPQVGTLNIKGGIISGATGVEVRGGTLNITGGDISATATTHTSVANGNGATSTGVAVAVAQHTTKQAIDVNISGGELSGVKAFAEENPEANADPAVTIDITGGEFDGDVAVTDDQSTEISGGTFSVAPDEDYMADGLVPVLVNGVYVTQEAPENSSNKSSTGIDTDGWKVVDFETLAAYEIAEDAQVNKIVYKNIEKTVNGKTTTYYGVTLYGPLKFEGAAAAANGGYAMVVAEESANMQIETDSGKIILARFLTRAEYEEYSAMEAQYAYTTKVASKFVKKVANPSKCEDAFMSYYVVGNEYYAAADSNADNTLVRYKNEFVLVGEKLSAAPVVPHACLTDDGTDCKWTVKNNKVVSVTCECDDTYKVVQDIKGLKTGTYAQVAYKADADSTTEVNYAILSSSTSGLLPSGTVVVTPSTDKVTSAETFDAGIAMYVGMSVMAAAGSAVVIGKKKD